MIDETRGHLGDLHATLMQRLPDVVHESDRLIVVPQGLLHLVPFHALHDGAQWVIQRSEVQYIPSVSLLLHLRSRSHQSADGPDLVVAGRTKALPGVRREAQVAAAMLGEGTVLLCDGDATIGAVREAAERAGVIHIIGHGRFMPTHVGASGVRLNDRWLSLHEIHDLRLRADLVVLSACESGPVQACTGDEPTGLFHGFLASGSRGLLATLWRVSDATSTIALASFHKHVQTGLVYASALREAQLETMQLTPHPAHWAPFIFAGVNA
jgi:CHAT domain-containing protein